MQGLKVKCCTCGCTDLYRTSEHYDPDLPLTGDMLELQDLYKDWPTYDGSLACKSTSRFLMFCAKCSGYVSTTGVLTFVDDEVPEPEPTKPSVHEDAKPTLPVLTLKAEEMAVTPEEMIKKLDKRANTSRKRKRK